METITEKIDKIINREAIGKQKDIEKIVNTCIRKMRRLDGFVKHIEEFFRRGVKAKVEEARHKHNVKTRNAMGAYNIRPKTKVLTKTNAKVSELYERIMKMSTRSGPLGYCTAENLGVEIKHLTASAEGSIRCAKFYRKIAEPMRKGETVRERWIDTKGLCEVWQDVMENHVSLKI